MCLKPPTIIVHVTVPSKNFLILQCRGRDSRGSSRSESFLGTFASFSEGIHRHHHHPSVPISELVKEKRGYKVGNEHIPRVPPLFASQAIIFSFLFFLTSAFLLPFTSLISMCSLSTNDHPASSAAPFASLAPNMFSTSFISSPWRPHHR